jgi:hypothetical protein
VLLVNLSLDTPCHPTYTRVTHLKGSALTSTTLAWTSRCAAPLLLPTTTPVVSLEAQQSFVYHGQTSMVDSADSADWGWLAFQHAFGSHTTAGNMPLQCSAV